MSMRMTQPTKWCAPSEDSVRQAWSESLLCALWVAKDPILLHADSEVSDQTGRMPRLIWVFAGSTLFCWFCHAEAQIINGPYLFVADPFFAGSTSPLFLFNFGSVFSWGSGRSVADFWAAFCFSFSFLLSSLFFFLRVLISSWTSWKLIP